MLDFPKTIEELAFEEKVSVMDRPTLWDYIEQNKDQMTTTELIIAFGYRSLLLTPEEKRAEDKDVMKGLANCCKPKNEKEAKVAEAGLEMLWDEVFNGPQSRGTKH